MKTAFVTGATGFIGYHVAARLLEKGWHVRAVRRGDAPHPSLVSDRIEWRKADLRDPAAIRAAMEGCDAVLHLAADYRLWAPKPEEIYKSNVDGTAGVMDAALDLQIGRVVYTSSVGALGLRSDGVPADETTPVSLRDMVGHYKRSKYLAERKVEEALHRGLPVVMVHPSTPVGPEDRKPTPTGKIIVDFLNGKMPAYLDTGLNLVHVRDVADGHLAALERGRIGEKYILGNQNLTLAQIFQLLEKVSGLPAPRLRLPHRPILMLAYACEALSRLTGKEPLVPLEGVRMAHKFMFFTSEKAVRELALPQTPVETALREAVHWFMENGYVKKS